MLNRLFLGVILLSATAVASANDSLVRFQSNYSVQDVNYKGIPWKSTKAAHICYFSSFSMEITLRV